MKNRKEIHFGKDILSGVIVALVSIPISMGYAQIAGLPAVYGLYGSILPIFIFGLITTSRQFVVGVDAMPAVMVGTMLAELGIAAETKEALSFVPTVSLLVALWFVLFFIFKMGRIVKYISSPVMGGFISGVGLTIILMQVPKLFGGVPGVGTVVPLIRNIYSQITLLHPLSLALGIGTTVIILLGKKFLPKVPFTAILLVVGGLLEACFHVSQHGVKLLAPVESGLPSFIFPQISWVTKYPKILLTQSFSIAIVIMAQTLLASGNYAMKYGDKLNANQELLAYAGMNILAGVNGCCPVNGSVSRSGIADSFGCRSQIMSIVAAITMLFVLLFGTPLLKYLPVPVLTGIVLAALIGIVEWKMIGRLWKTSRNELLIFIISMLGVLFLGTVNGVIIGTILSFIEVSLRATVPPANFVGRIPGHGNYYSLGRNSNARPIKQVVIYRFGGNLFFANIDKFEKDIEKAIQEDTKCVVVDARGIGSIDITATDRLLSFADSLKKKGIRFYLTEHEGSLNDQIRRFGGVRLIEEDHVRRTISLALRDAGFEKPYVLEGETVAVNQEDVDVQLEKLVELEWAFGVEAGDWLEKLAEKEAQEIAREMHEEVAEKRSYQELMNHIFGATRLHTSWGLLGRFDENEFWDYLEIKLDELFAAGKITQAELLSIEKEIETRRMESEKRLSIMNSSALRRLREHRKEHRKRMRQQHPEAYAHMNQLNQKVYKDLQKKNPVLAEAIKELHER